ncbi:unnamed protein product [Caenorhabditis auriculariae]|uniref:Uncharacterized protein n=1 Tax=Caenorhabditis auriculariae TaxID=2777116 RepID=A0A8S1GT50_9PELO|nr:unnamed protein product [Caenorhabditis auriculariae]
MLEGDDDMIQRTVREHFLGLHSGELSDFSIQFTDKSEGTSIGNVCEVKFSGMRRRFFIKCHQRGPRSTSLSIANRYSSINRPFVQEIYVYELLSLIKVGGEVHFPIPITDTRKALYIATEEINFTVAKQLTAQTVNSNAMILVDFLQFILRLEDVGTNGGNYGQTDEGDAVVVDFWVIPKDDYVHTDDQCSDFWNALHNCNSRLISDVLKR